MQHETFLKPREASKLLNVTVRTLFNWDASGKIKSIRTHRNQRRYILSSFPKYNEFLLNENKQKICYCRVSTPSQKEDLERQIQFFKREYPNHKIIKDVGSGLNFKRKGFN